MFVVDNTHFDWIAFLLNFIIFGMYPTTKRKFSSWNLRFLRKFYNLQIKRIIDFARKRAFKLSIVIFHPQLQFPCHLFSFVEQYKISIFHCVINCLVWEYFLHWYQVWTLKPVSLGKMSVCWIILVQYSSFSNDTRSIFYYIYELLIYILTLSRFY